MLQGDTLQEYVQGVGQYGGVQMVVCILPNSRLDRYAAIKRHVTCVMSVPSQVCSSGCHMSILSSVLWSDKYSTV